MTKTFSLKSLIKKGMLIAALFGLTAGCGNSIPPIDPEVLAGKSAVLLVTDSTLEEKTAEELSDTLQQWRNEQGMAYEWWKDVSKLDAEAAERMNGKAYDYIIVIGSGLSGQAISTATLTEEKRWVVMEDAVSSVTGSVYGSADDHLLHRIVPAERLEHQWDEWVAQQYLSGRKLLWVTTTASPVPDKWLPDTGAENAVHYVDQEGWLRPLQQQTQRSPSASIVVFAPLEEEAEKQLQLLKTPVVRIGTGDSIRIDWKLAVSSFLEELKLHGWSPGIRPYNEQELTIIRGG